MIYSLSENEKLKLENISLKLEVVKLQYETLIASQKSLLKEISEKNNKSIEDIEQLDIVSGIIKFKEEVKE